MKKKRFSLSCLYRKLETKFLQIYHNWKSYIIKICIVVLIAYLLLMLNLNLNMIPYISKVNIQLPILNTLLGKEINLFFILIHVLSTIPIIIMCKTFFKPIKYEDQDEQLEKAYMPNANEEKRLELAPKTIVNYPNPYNKNNELLMAYKNS